MRSFFCFLNFVCVSVWLTAQELVTYPASGLEEKHAIKDISLERIKVNGMIATPLKMVELLRLGAFVTGLQ